MIPLQKPWRVAADGALVKHDVVSKIAVDERKKKIIEVTGERKFTAS